MQYQYLGQKHSAYRWSLLLGLPLPRLRHHLRRARQAGLSPKAAFENALNTIIRRHPH
jgi:hypothetical protein